MAEEVDLIIDKALALAGRDFIDGDVVESVESFGNFMATTIQTALPSHTFSIPELGTILGAADWSFTMNVAKLLEDMKPFSPGANRDIIVQVLHRLII